MLKAITLRSNGVPIGKPKMWIEISTFSNLVISANFLEIEISRNYCLSFWITTHASKVRSSTT